MHTNKNKNFVITASIVLTISFVFVFTPKTALATAISNQKIVELINKERTVRGLNPLNIDEDLCRAANLKSSNMLAKNYFEHFAYGVSPWVLIQNSGYNYQYAGENLAKDFVTAEGVVAAWMASPAHRKNLLSSDFEDVCVGIAKGNFTENDGQTHETIMVTQMFGKRKPVILSVASEILYRVFGIINR